MRALARRRGVPLRVVINEALRASAHPATASMPYALPIRRLGVRPGVDVDKALALAATLEDEEIARRLELRK